VDRLQKALHDGDPVKDEPELSAGSSQAMLRQVLARRTILQHASASPGPKVLIFTVAAALTIGIALGRLREGPTQRETVTASPETPRQVQFETRGGTLLVWVLKSD